MKLELRNLRTIGINDLDSLTQLEKEQFVIAMKEFMGHKIDLLPDYRNRYENELDELFEEDGRGERLNVYLVEVYDLADDGQPRYDLWAYIVDCAVVFLHGTTEQAGVYGTQGGFDTSTGTEEDVRLAKALDRAVAKSGHHFC